MKKGYVLITGGNKGIGLELAKIFAKNNYPLILVGTDILALYEARNVIKKNYKVPVNLIQRDLTKRNTPNEIYNIIKGKKIQVDILVNNAGFGTYGPFIETNLEKELDLIELNIRALTHLTKLFSKDMAKRFHGKILNISSTSAFQGGPYMAVYFASKAFILHFSDALHSEFKPYGLQVTALCPGPTDTNFTDCAKGSGQAKIFQSMLSPKRVAKAGYNALMKNKLFKVVGIKNNLLRQLNRILPRETAINIAHNCLLKQK
ncbi:short-chain dehydrogenase [Vallitalea longa]|uniref:Short-chain dehydrogenase n=1 Tax=Vallitalea longa TaxID=2936439 RepID=A0A9W5YCB2_9FIRM|nr:SDR family oxidoreductase [Vallitalea longa]GKX29319.1 short-chain dehydrogenase [Vallitalea longa]